MTLSTASRNLSSDIIVIELLVWIYIVFHI